MTGRINMSTAGEDYGPKSRTRRRSDSARNKIISLRVSDEEMQLLGRLSKRMRRSMSEVMREALNSFLQAQHDRRCLQG